MKNMKRLFALATLMAMLGTSSGTLSAQEYRSDMGGIGYSDGYRSTSLAPAIALATVAVIAIIAVAVQNTHGHSHCHSHACHN